MTNTYRITIEAWGKKSTQTLKTDSAESAIFIARQTQYQGCCPGDLHTDIYEGRVPVVKTEIQIIDNSKETLEWIFVPLNQYNSAPTI